MSIVKKAGLMIATIVIVGHVGVGIADTATPAVPAPVATAPTVAASPTAAMEAAKPALPAMNPIKPQTTSPLATVDKPLQGTQTAKATDANAVTIAPIGKVVWVKGSFSAIRPNTVKRPLQKDAAIYKGDTLITDDKSQAQIAFTDLSLVTFREGTKFEVKEYEYKPENKTGSVGKYVMNLIEGGFRTITGLIPKANPKDYAIHTPVATIGVRGTDYSVYLQKGGGLFIGQIKGAPCVSSDSGETLCLDDKNQYAKVDESSGVPVPLSQRPEVFDQPLTIVPVRSVSFAPTATGPSSFCIQ